MFDVGSYPPDIPRNDLELTHIVPNILILPVPPPSRLISRIDNLRKIESLPGGGSCNHLQLVLILLLLCRLPHLARARVFEVDKALGAVAIHPLLHLLLVGS